MESKLTDAKNKLEELNLKKASSATVLAITAITAVFFIGGTLGAFSLNDNSVNSKTLTFQSNGTALNVSGNGTINLGIATGEKLNFGRIPVEASSTKFLNINARKKALVTINAEGNISQALDFDKTHYFKGQRDISLRFDPKTAETFEGNVTVTVKTANNEVGSRWLDFKSKVY